MCGPKWWTDRQSVRPTLQSLEPKKELIKKVYFWISPQCNFTSMSWKQNANIWKRFLLKGRKSTTVNVCEWKVNNCQIKRCMWLFSYCREGKDLYTLICCLIPPHFSLWLGQWLMTLFRRAMFSQHMCARGGKSGGQPQTCTAEYIRANIRGAHKCPEFRAKSLIWDGGIEEEQPYYPRPGL